MRRTNLAAVGGPRRIRVRIPDGQNGNPGYSDGLTQAQPDLLMDRSVLAALIDDTTSAAGIADRLIELGRAAGPLTDDLTTAVLRAQRSVPIDRERLFRDVGRVIGLATVNELTENRTCPRNSTLPRFQTTTSSAP